MLSVWLDINGIIHWQMLPNGYIITADVYWQQLDRIAENSMESRIEFTIYMITLDPMLQSRPAKTY
jgi:hypothetical protein